MYDLKERAKKAQQELLDVVLEFYKQNPESYFTAGDIIRELGVIPGKDQWFAHAHLTILVEIGKLEKGPPRKGFKYKENNCIKMAI